MLGLRFARLLRTCIVEQHEDGHTVFAGSPLTTTGRVYTNNLQCCELVHAPLFLYLDQNYLSGIVKRKAAFSELEPTLRATVARGAVVVPESEAHEVESAARPDLPLLALLRELSGGAALPRERGTHVRHCELRLQTVLERDFPERRVRRSDRLDVRALAVALPRCRLLTCDAFMADVVRRTRLDLRFRCELFTGRRVDVERLRRRLERL